MMHGHSPRVRRRYNQKNGEDVPDIKINRDKLASRMLGAAVGAVIGTATTRAVFGENNG